MDDAPHAPVFPALLQYARLTPLCASSRTHHCTPKTVPPNPNPDLAVLCSPPESTPSSLWTTSRPPTTSARRGRSPATCQWPPFPFPWPFARFRRLQDLAAGELAIRANPRA